MLQESAYDVLEFSMPSQGMNQNISPDVLPPSFAYALENILPKPLGEGQVRFGTARVAALPNPESVILKLFPFVKPDGAEQILLYVQEYALDAAAHSFAIKSPFCFSFVSPQNAQRYAKDTAIRAEYALQGQRILYDALASVTVGGAGVPANTVCVTLSQNALPLQAAVSRASFATGTLYSYDLGSGALSPPLRQNLATACIPRSAAFLGKLLICNGVDRVLSWDGTTMAEVCAFVREEVSGLTRIDDRRFSFVVSPTFDLSHYAVGNAIHLTINGITTQAGIAARTLTNQTLTVSTAQALPTFGAGLPAVALAYQAWPPRFNFLFVAHDRLWALGEGAAGRAYRPPQEAMRVYYAFKPNAIDGWFNDRTQTVPSIDLSKKHGEPDNLEAICLIGPFIAFMGRKKTQVYQGQNPLSFQEGGDFAHHALLPTGVIHGDLLVELPNDVFFIAPTGLQSLSSLNSAKQLAATSFDAVNPLIRQYAASLTESDLNFRSCGAFKHGAGAIAGFKIGKNKVLCSLFSTSLDSWSMFSGDFEQAAGFLTLGSRLYLALHNQIYAYADGQDGRPPVYGDQDGQGLIPFSWTLPVVSLQGRRFANKRYELCLDYPSSFIARPDNQISIGVGGDLPKSYRMASPCRFEMRGDALQTVPLVREQEPREDSAGFRLDRPFGFFKDRFRFLASKFWLTLSGYAKDGPLTFKKIKLYGIIERS